MNGTIKKIKDRLGNYVFPITSTHSVYMDDGMTKVHDKLLDVDSKVNENTQDITENVNRINTIDGQLAEKTYYCKTIADMKNNQKLKLGDYITTLGYYSVNDGGDGTYVITNSAEIDNGGTVHDLSNGLKAELVPINGQLNIKQWGAKGDGITDDSLIIQKAINYLRNKIISANEFGKTINCLVFPFGHYALYSQVKFSTYLKYKAISTVYLKSYIASGSAIKIVSTNGDIYDTALAKKRNWMHGNIIDGSSGSFQLIGMVDKDINDTTGLELADDTGLLNGSYGVNTFNINNITITSFNVGLLINPINFYIGNFNSVRITLCNTDFKIGNTGATNISSGENISFDNCSFGSSGYAGEWNVPSFDITFNKCSFDFLSKGIFIFRGAYSKVTLNDCHLEHILCDPAKNSMITEEGITGSVTPIQLNFNNCALVTLDGVEVFPLVTGNNIRVKISNFLDRISSGVVGLDNVRNMYLCNAPVQLSQGNRCVYRGISRKSNNNIDGTFLSETIDTVGTNLKNYLYTNLLKTQDVVVKQGFDEYSTEKCLLASQDGTITDHYTFELETKNFIEYKPNNRIGVCASFYIPSGYISFQHYYKFYDYDKNLISTTTSTSAGTINTAGKWVKKTDIPAVSDSNIPVNAVYYKAILRVMAYTTDSIYVTDICQP